MSCLAELNLPKLAIRHFQFFDIIVKHQLLQPVLWIFSPQIVSAITLTLSLVEGKLFKSPSLPQTQEFYKKETAWVRYLSLHTAIRRAGERSRLLVKTAAVSGPAKEKKKRGDHHYIFFCLRHDAGRLAAKQPEPPRSSRSNHVASSLKELRVQTMNNNQNVITRKNVSALSSLKWQNVRREISQPVCFEFGGRGDLWCSHDDRLL